MLTGSSFVADGMTIIVRGLACSLFVGASVCPAIAGAQETAEPDSEAAADATAPAAQPATEATAGEEVPADGEEYAEATVVELGGSIGLLWTDESFTVDLSPSIGYFVADGLELSLIVDVSYESREDPETGTRHKHESYALLLEPSYHAPLRENLYLLAGVGVGVGHDGDNFDFEIVPRAGLNIGLSNDVLLTPALRAPIIIDSDGTTVGVGFQVGLSYAW